MVEGAAAHEGQRRNFDGVVFEVTLQFGARDHVAQGIIERLKIWVELVLEVAGEESKVLVGFDGWTCQDDPSHLFGL